MAKKLPKEYLVLGGIIIVLVLIFVLINIGKSLPGQNIPNVSKLKKDDISKISYIAQGEMVTISKNKNNKWLIEPMNYPADKAAVDSMLSNIADVEIKELISDKKIYDMYNLDDANKISVSGFIGDKPVRIFDVGKTTDSSSFTFIKLKDNPNIYSVKGNVKTVFEKKIPDLRDKVILSIKKEEITELTLEDGTKTVHIKKGTKKEQTNVTDKKDEKTQTAEAPVWKSDLSDVPVADTVINDIFEGMTNLSCESYIDGKTKQDFASQPFYYRVTAHGAKDYVLTYMDKGAQNKLTAISSESDYPALIISWKAQKATRKFEKGEVK